MPLLALPNELLYRIFDDTEITKELYFLALLSRRLHHICLSLFLAQNGVPSPADKAAICIKKRETVIDALSALRIALFVPAIRELDFSYSTHLNCDAGLTGFSAQIDRLYSLVQRLDTVENIKISVGTLCDLCIKESGKFEDVVAKVKNLFDLAAQKACNSLTISGRGWRDIVNFESSLEENCGFRRLLNAIKQVPHSVMKSRTSPKGMQGPGWKFVAATCGERRKPFFDLARLNLVPSHVASARVGTLVVRSAIMLTPPFSSWFLHVLKDSGIHRLEFDGIASYLGLDAWSAVLPCVSRAAQNLTHLSISQCEIHIVDLLQFLCHLPRLASLSLDDDFPGEPCATFRDRYPYSPRPRPTPDFPALTRLRAPIQLVRHFLNNSQALMKLESLEVVAYQTGLVDLDASLALIYNHLCCSDSKKTPSFGVDVQYGDQNEIREDIEEFCKTQSSTVLTCVSSISFQLRWANHPDNPFAAPPKVSVTQAICEWLRVFPQATDVSLKLRIFHEETGILMDSVRSSSPNIQRISLTVNGNTL